MAKSKKIAPSLLSADFCYLGRDIQMLEGAGADIMHIDVMDGHFVPNITIGIPVLQAIKKYAKTPCDVHLMIEKPERYVEDFVKAGADYLTVHWEACTHLHRTLQHIRSLGCKSGVSLNPHTPISALEEILDEVDLILIMSVNPGFGGQSFIPNSLERIKKLKDLLDKRGLNNIEIEVDGGVKLDNIKAVADAGADIIVSGSGIFNGKPEETIAEMKKLIG
ncbi:MAG: ribulose-phosphate 3-epimerase [Flavobacteriaceae bacterium]|nr:ribulose-phosphate 3-epimerase [Flavobacteriaceae bacterium]